jgi:predicted Zn-dependent peptidase
MGSWKDMLTYPDIIASIKPDEIPSIVKKYLNPSKMTIGKLLYKENSK